MAGTRPAPSMRRLLTVLTTTTAVYALSAVPLPSLAGGIPQPRVPASVAGAPVVNIR